MSEIGEILRERRMALKIDVNEVEEATKIRAKYLRALENAEYDMLPGNAYVKSFLRTYADYLGLDSRELVDAYRAEGHQSGEDPLVFAAARESSGRRFPRWVLVVVALLLLAALLLVVGTLSGAGGV
jgi:cytoskeletal protein RodZ